MEGHLGVRKGAWTPEEDDLLKKCIQRHGEGKWHQVPFKAGLNRCRKSCRLRWLNYLKPNIKRGEFAEDEVDLIIRLHKLLGNRWSLIAGRLPGRTSNDIKNFWNSHLRKTMVSHTEEQIHQRKPNINVIKPRPRVLSRSLTRPLEENICNTPPPPQPPPLSVSLDNEILWWESFLNGEEGEQGTIDGSTTSDFQDEAIAKYFGEETFGGRR
ncbi:hypothetical protein SLEP1_g12910 [Rubroshorea leprosula]|uniref:Uncharacterized protein n=1 Tax=Rubroshorea leprosula TaxID=152421 RepID=A0AAV5IQF3_9ROSI|nr:hypothetical protein SLEP1_g12910 [Rubroshorea leprosula]